MYRIVGVRIYRKRIESLSETKQKKKEREKERKKEIERCVSFSICSQCETVEYIKPRDIKVIVDWPRLQLV